MLQSRIKLKFYRSTVADISDKKTQDWFSLLCVSEKVHLIILTMTSIPYASLWETENKTIKEQSILMSANGGRTKDVNV